MLIQMFCRYFDSSTVIFKTDVFMTYTQVNRSDTRFDWIWSDPTDRQNPMGIRVVELLLDPTGQLYFLIWVLISIYPNTRERS